MSNRSSALVNVAVGKKKLMVQQYNSAIHELLARWPTVEFHIGRDSEIIRWRSQSINCQILTHS